MKEPEVMIIYQPSHINITLPASCTLLMWSCCRHTSAGCGTPDSWDRDCWWSHDKADSKKHCHPYKEISSFHHLPGSADHCVNSGTKLQQYLKHIVILPQHVACMSLIVWCRSLKVKEALPRIAGCSDSSISLEFRQLQGKLGPSFFHQNDMICWSWSSSQAYHFVDAEIGAYRRLKSHSRWMLMATSTSRQKTRALANQRK